MQIIEVPDLPATTAFYKRTVGQALDVPVLEMIEEVVTMPRIVSRDRIQPRVSCVVQIFEVPPVLPARNACCNLPMPLCRK